MLPSLMFSTTAAEPPLPLLILGVTSASAFSVASWSLLSRVSATLLPTFGSTLYRSVRVLPSLPRMTFLVPGVPRRYCSKAYSAPDSPTMASML